MNNEQETIVLGIVGIKNMGVYNPETEYEKLNVVTYQGSSYCALKNTVGNLPTNSEYWQLYASKGDTGNNGPKGATGDPGPKGDTGNPGASPIAVSSAGDMIDTTKIYVLTTDGHWYWYDTNTTSWKDGGEYQATGIADNSITPEKTTFINKKLNDYNLFDKDSLISGYYIGGLSQTPVENPSFGYYQTYDLIPGQTYTRGGYGSMIISAFNGVENVLLHDVSTNNTFTIPNDAINIYISSGLSSAPNQWISKGSSAYITNTSYAKEYLINEDIINMNKYNPNNIGDKTVTPEKTTFIDKNLNENNILDISNLTEGYYVGSSITPASNANYGYYQSYDFENEQTYRANGEGVIIVSCFTNENVNLLTNDSSVNATFTIPEGTDKVFVSVSLAYKNNMWINKGSSPYPSNTPYRKKYLINNTIDMSTFNMNFIKVNINGKGDYTSLTEAVNNASSGDNIIVYPGIYTNETVEAFGKVLNIIGVNKDTCIIKNNNCDYATPPMEFGAGMLKNLSIISEYDATNYNNVSGWKSYALHIEDDNLTNKKLLVENCYIESQVNYAVGMGTRGGSKVEFNNCWLNGSSPRVDDGGGGLYFHDAANVAYAGVQNISFINNKITSQRNGATTDLRIESQGTTGSSVYVEFINNVIINQANGTITNRFVDHASGQWKTNFDDLTNFTLTYTSYGNNDSKVNKV